MWRNSARENIGQVLHIHHEYSKIKKRGTDHAGEEGGLARPAHQREPPPGV